MQENETSEVASTEEANSQTTDSTIASETVGERTENQVAQDDAGNLSEKSNDAVDNNDGIAAQTGETAPSETAEPEEEEEITYHAVQKEDSVTAIWEMQGRKHIRTIDPRSREGAEILRLFTAEEGEEAGEAAAAA